MNQIFKNKSVLVILGLIVLLTLIITNLLFGSLDKKITIPRSGTSKGITIESIEPQGALVPNQSQTITIITGQQISADQLKISLTNDLSHKSVPLNININQKSLTIKLDQIEPDNSYTLQVNNGKTDSKLYTGKYTTFQPVATTVSKNNLELSKYLPYDTTTYSMNYDSDHNLYRFHFKPNDNSTTQLETQFENAKQEAINFIKSKGVDPNSIQIDWKYF